MGMSGCWWSLATHTGSERMDRACCCDDVYAKTKQLTLAVLGDANQHTEEDGNVGDKPGRRAEA
jgi:hypothetical protein